MQSLICNKNSPQSKDQALNLMRKEGMIILKGFYSSKGKLMDYLEKESTTLLEIKPRVKEF